MQQETANKLVGVQGHMLLGIAMSVVTPPEADGSVLQTNEAAVRYRNAVGVATEIGKDVLRRTERWLCIDDPGLFAHWLEGVDKRGLGAQAVKGTEKPQLPGGMGSPQAVQKQTTEQKRQNRNGQEETRSAGDPALTVDRQRAAGHETMDMWMMCERLPPGVENGNEAEFAAKMPGIGTNGLERLGHSIEQDRVDDCLVLIGDGRDIGGDRKYDVKIRDRQKVSFASGDPSFTRRRLALGTMSVAA